MAEPNQTFLDTKELSRLLFPAAAEAWLNTRKPYISLKTHHEYKLNIKTLSRFFAEIKPTEITADQIRAYQQMRSAGCGPFAINHECSLLQQILKRIGRWHVVSPDYQPLPLPKEQRGRVLSDEERTRLLRIAESNPNWEAAYLFVLISVNTSAGPKETATLRLKDVDPERGAIRVQPHGAKNIHRVRTIPLNEEALRGLKLALARAKRLGAVAEDHYLFPFCIKRGTYDPSRYQTTFKTAWRKLTETAHLTGLRMYDLRHHAITALLENPDVSEQTAEDIAGHISWQMKKRYSHIRIEVKRAAVNALSRSVQAPIGQQLTNEHVREMLSSLPAEIVVAKIKASSCAFDVSVEALKQLTTASIPTNVLLAMVRAVGPRR